MFSKWLARFFAEREAESSAQVFQKVSATEIVVDNQTRIDIKRADPIQSFKSVTLYLIRGSIENSSGQVGRLETENGELICFVCEDVSRLPALKEDRSNYNDIAWLCDPENPNAAKIYGQTAIPAGLYQVGVRHDRKRAQDERRRYFSQGDWHNLGVMELLDVPGFTYIQFHPGNYPRDTLGCFLPGGWNGKNVWVQKSRDTYKPFYEKYAPIAEAGVLWFKIIDADR